MALCLADSLLAREAFDPADQLTRYGRLVPRRRALVARPVLRHRQRDPRGPAPLRAHRCAHPGRRRSKRRRQRRADEAGAGADGLRGAPRGGDHAGRRQRPHHPRPARRRRRGPIPRGAAHRRHLRRRPRRSRRGRGASAAAALRAGGTLHPEVQEVADGSYRGNGRLRSTAARTPSRPWKRRCGHCTPPTTTRPGPSRR